MTRTVVCEVNRYPSLTRKTGKVRNGGAFGINAASYHGALADTTDVVRVKHLDKTVQEQFYLASSCLYLYQSSFYLPQNWLNLTYYLIFIEWENILIHFLK